MILISGSTGFLGSAMLGDMLDRHPEQELGLLIRASKGSDGEERGRAVLTRALGRDRAELESARVRVIAGDLVEENFGLGQTEFEELARQTSMIFHSAASTSFTQSISEAREINLRGTESLLRLAQLNSGNVAFRHISTAYVAGTSEGVVSPYHLGTGFRNTYEQSKAEAESLLRENRHHLRDLVVFRPSIIVGDSQTGETTSFNVIYAPSKMLIKGMFSVVPGNPASLLDVVPVDYVARVISALAARVRETGSYTSLHVCSGVGREASIKEIIECLVNTFNKFSAHKFGAQRLQFPEFLSPEMLARLNGAIAQAALHGIKNIERFLERNIPFIGHLLPYVHYMLHNPQFCTQDTMRELGDEFGPAPLFTAYADKVFGYCFASDWGRQPVAAI